MFGHPHLTDDVNMTTADPIFPYCAVLFGSYDFNIRNDVSRINHLQTIASHFKVLCPVLLTHLWGGVCYPEKYQCNTRAELLPSSPATGDDPNRPGCPQARNSVQEHGLAGKGLCMNCSLLVYVNVHSLKPAWLLTLAVLLDLPTLLGLPHVPAYSGGVGYRNLVPLSERGVLE